MKVNVLTLDVDIPNGFREFDIRTPKKGEHYCLLCTKGAVAYVCTEDNSRFIALILTKIIEFPKELKTLVPKGTWAAKDSSGHWWLYENKPARITGVWALNSVGKYFHMDTMLQITWPECDWKDSLLCNE